MPNPHLEIESTADGSVTLFREDLNEHYHSVKGALEESLHVYVSLGWEYFARQHQSVRVFEAGFGTGLNAALTAHAALLARVPTTYHAIELHPLSAEMIERLLPYQNPEYREVFKAVNVAPWDQDVSINPFFTLHKIKGDLLISPLPEGIEVVYFDAFAPEKQPEMWSPTVFETLLRSMRPGGVLTTYCAKGAIRRLLQQTGFRTERLPGPERGKREVLRATRQEDLDSPES